MTGRPCAVGSGALWPVRACEACDGSGRLVPDERPDGALPPLATWPACLDCDGSGVACR